MTAPVLAVVKLAMKSGIPSDVVQNTFAFEYDLTGIGASALNTALVAFYNANHVGPGALNSYLSEALSTSSNANTISYYDLTGHLSGTPHGSPVAVTQWTLGATGTGTPGPNEVCMCLTAQADYGTDVEFGPGTRPRARDRSRVYIGPLEITLVTAEDTTTHAITVGTSPQQSLAASGAALLAANVGWSVWSRRDAALKPVVSGWVDNAFDIQRRRGIKASARTTF